MGDRRWPVGSTHDENVYAMEVKLGELRWSLADVQSAVAVRSERLKIVESDEGRIREQIRCWCRRSR